MYLQMIQGEARLIKNEWAQQAERAGATVSASTWSYDGTATLASPTLVGTLATVLFTPTISGVLTNKATFSNGEIMFDTWDVEVDY